MVFLEVCFFVSMILTMTETTKKLSNQEAIKENSQYLYGNILKELQDRGIIEVSDESYELLKFHGTYQGYNRDTATERKKQKLDKEFEFMLDTIIS